MTDAEKRELIFDTVDDLVKDFLIYGRKEDEQLDANDLRDAILLGTVTVDEIVNRFRKTLESDTEPKEWPQSKKAVVFESNLLGSAYGQPPVKCSDKLTVFNDGSIVIDYEDSEEGDFQLFISADTFDEMLRALYPEEEGHPLPVMTPRMWREDMR